MKTGQTEFNFQDWERRVVVELYDEYSWILRSRKMHLRPVAIELFDSDSLWGRWDSLTRTISISRKLVHQFPWFHVLAVLRHEMAHQFLDEMPGDLAKDARPHGEQFKRACRMLGVPDDFSYASASLQENSPDWRNAKRDEVTEKLLDKVRKLLALATSSNEYEALLAMNKVRELYAKYNLEDTAKAEKQQFSHLMICHGKRRLEIHQDTIIGILVGHFFVQVVTSKMFDAKSGESHSAIEIIGTRENALIAEYVYHFLLHQTDFLVREMAKNRGGRASRVERKSYRLGILKGFREKLRHSEQPQGSSVQGDATSGTELTVIGKALQAFKKDRQLDDYLAHVYPRLGTRSSSGQLLDDHAFSAGRAVGQTITLKKAIHESGGNKGRLLPEH